MLKIVWSFLILFTSFPTFGGELNLSFGPSLDGTVGAQKMTTINYEITWGSPSLELEIGGWNEPAGASVYFSATPGIHVITSDGFSSRIGFGPAILSETDDRLSSLFEFHLQARFGIEKNGWATGLQFDHFSNAGLVGPNLGRDVGSLYVGIPL